jgi:hypothetical protein
MHILLGKSKFGPRIKANNSLSASHDIYRPKKAELEVKANVLELTIEETRGENAGNADS